MTREHKLALILGFAVTLVVGMLLSDHFSKASQADLASPAAQSASPSLSTAAASTGAGASTAVQSAEAPLLDEPLPAGAESALRDPLLLADAPAGTQGVTLERLSAQRQQRKAAPVRQTAFTPAAQLTTAEAPRATPQPAATRRWVVQPGDTLWSICVDAYGDGSLHRSVALYNRDRLGPSGVLRAGQTLLLPPRSMLTGAVAPSARSAASRKPAQTSESSSSSHRTYVVQRGDTLSEIAMRRLGSVRRMGEILALNRDILEDADDIRPGMTLKLPPR